MQLPAGHTGPLTLACKATDAAYNTQPDDPSSIWNIRGGEANVEGGWEGGQLPHRCRCFEGGGGGA